MSDTIRVRPAVPADVAVLTRFNITLARETEGHGLDPYTVERGVRRVFAGGTGASYVVAEVGGEVVGGCMTTGEWSDWRNGEIAWLQSVYVDPEHRGRGVFAAMLAEVERASLAKGCVALRLYVERENGRAIRTYERHGLTSTAYRVMEKTLA